MSDALKTPEQIEAALMRQEHRLFYVFLNFLVRRRKFAKDDERRAAATSAFLWRLVAPGSLVTGGVGVTAIVGLFLASQANTLLGQANALLGEQNLKVDQQNALLQTQNQKIEEQNMLSESSRRAGLIFELTAILDRINEEITQQTLDKTQNDAGVRNARILLKDITTGRVVALSRSLRPYRYLNDEGKLEERPLSPERGQLLISLLASGVEMDAIAEQGRFSQADLRGAFLGGANLPKADLQGAFLEEAYLSKADLRGASLEGANLVRAELQEADLQGANLIQANLEEADLQGANFQRVRLREANLREAKLWNADLQGASLFMAILQKVGLFNANLAEADLVLADLAEADLTGASVTAAQLCTAHSLYQARLAASLQAQIQEGCPHLLEDPAK
jgi:uncharacterized protein YjbI with pentapeptide repeats